MSLFETDGRLDLTDSEMKTLATFAMHLERQAQARYLEIGVYGGGTIKYIKHMAKNMDCTGIDLFEDFIINDNNTHITPNHNMIDVQNFVGNDIRLIKGDSTEILSELYTNQEKFDLIFIDGNHKYEAVKIDYMNALKILNPKGFIALHNASPHGHPDFDLYNTNDGGPWLLSLEIEMDNIMRCVAKIDRLYVFGLL
jgi:predicted O-methyltransferase YrrM